MDAILLIRCPHENYILPWNPSGITKFINRYLWSDVILQIHYVIFHITRLQEILREVKMGCLHTSAFQVLHRNKIYVLYLLLQMLSTVLNGKNEIVYKRDILARG